MTASCAAAPRTPAPTSSTLAAPCGSLTLTVVGAPAEARRVQEAIPEACAALGGHRPGLTAPTGVTIHGTVDAFVDATGQTVDTLRAWSTPTAVHLLTLAAWRDADRTTVVRRLTHELCHVALFQRLGARARAVPRALAEGICSVVADQGAERLPLDEVRARVAAGGAVDFVDDSPLSYGIAHHVVAGIVACQGEASMLPIVDAVADGTPLEQVLGAPPLAFLQGCGPPDAEGGTSAPEGVHSRR